MTPTAGNSCSKHLLEQFKFHIDIPQCKHVFLGVAHDSGYVTFLRSLIEAPSIRDRVTLLENSRVHPAFTTLNFKQRIRFPTVFSDESSPTTDGRQKLTQSTTTGSGFPKERLRSTPYSSRFGIIKTNERGERVDLPLSVDSSFAEFVKQVRLCPSLYLTGLCADTNCRLNHRLPPLNSKQYNALWVVHRRVLCSANGACRDCHCFRGHVSKCSIDMD